MNEVSPRRGFRAAALVHLPPQILFLALSLWVTAPLWFAPASRIQSLSDPLLNSYILDWVHYALFHQLADFFQASVFWPHADALVYGEHLIAPAILVLPFRLFTSSAVALHNLSLLEAFFFSAAAAYALGYYYFRSVAPATLAGVLYGFALYRIAQSGHIQLAHGEFLPITVLAFEKALRTGARGWAVLLGLAALGQWLTSWYWAVFSLLTLAPYISLRLWKAASSDRPHFVAAVLPLFIAALAVLPVAYPYFELRRQNLLFRPSGASAGLAARPADFLRPPARSLLWGRLYRSGPNQSSERPLFPGAVASLGAGAALALFLSKRLRRPRTRNESPERGEWNEFPLGLWLSLTAALLVFSFGSEFRSSSGLVIPLPYALVERLIPIAGLMRVPARWMLPASLGIALLAAYSANAVLARLAERRWFAVGLIAAAGAESLTLAMPYVEVEVVPPPAHAWLAEQPYPSPVVELPIPPDTDNRPMLHATWHRQPTMNGTNGFFPPGHHATMAALAGFPDLWALDVLRRNEVRIVLIDRDRMPPGSPATDPDELRSALRARGYSPNVRTIGRHLVIELFPDARAPRGLAPQGPYLNPAVTPTPAPRPLALSSARPASTRATVPISGHGAGSGRPGRDATP